MRHNRVQQEGQRIPEPKSILKGPLYPGRIGGSDRHPRLDTVPLPLPKRPCDLTPCKAFSFCKKEVLKQVGVHVSEASGGLVLGQGEGELGVHEGEFRTLVVVRISGLAAKLVVADE